MNSNERRASILEESVRCFAEKGFRGTTTRELAAALGVTEPVLYQHFPTKKDLYAAILEQKAGEGAHDLKELGDDAAGDDRAFFLRLGNLILDRYEQDPCFIRLLLFSSLEGHELSDMFFQKQIRGFYEMVGGYIERRTRAGAFRDVEPMVAARAFIGMVSYHGLVKVIFQDRVVKADRQHLLDEMVSLFLEGIRSRP
jgi:AcrR family transcriptional regulator